MLNALASRWDDKVHELKRNKHLLDALLSWFHRYDYMYKRHSWHLAVDIQIWSSWASQYDQIISTCRCMWHPNTKQEQSQNYCKIFLPPVTVPQLSILRNAEVPSVDCLLQKLTMWSFFCAHISISFDKRYSTVKGAMVVTSAAAVYIALCACRRWERMNGKWREEKEEPWMLGSNAWLPVIRLLNYSTRIITERRQHETPFP